MRAIAHAQVKTDKMDAAVLAKLHAAGFLPEVRQPDEERNDCGGRSPSTVHCRRVEKQPAIQSAGRFEHHGLPSACQ